MTYAGYRRFLGLALLLAPAGLPAQERPRPPEPLPAAALDAGTAPRRPPSPCPLALAEVVEAVDRAFPLLVAAAQERDITAGQLLSTQGAFDTVLRARGVSIPEGSYESNRLDVVIEQPTPYWGLSTFAGYRFGYGEYPSYYGYNKTADGGEFRGGVQLPLLRDGAIDRRRAAITQAGLARAATEPAIQRARLDYLRAATRAYWAWVASGQRRFLGQELLRIASRRQEQFEALGRLGQMAPVVVLDNQRLVIDRQARLVVLTRRFQEAAVELSLYLRDPDGRAMLPAEERLPDGADDFPGFPVPREPQVGLVEQDIALALNRRPELKRLSLQRERAAVDLRLAENQMMPALNVAVAGSRDVGPGKKDLDKYNVELSVGLEVPLQLRDASGRTQAAQGLLRQIAAQEQFARDRITADVIDSVSALDQAYQLIQRNRRNVELARQLEAAEREAFRLGQSDLIKINLRELATFDAALVQVDALAEYYRALADYRAALALDVPAE